MLNYKNNLITYIMRYLYTLFIFKFINNIIWVFLAEILEDVGFR